MLALFIFCCVTFFKSHRCMLKDDLHTGQLLRRLHTAKRIFHDTDFVTKKQRHGSLVKPRAIYKAIEEVHFQLREVGLHSASSF